MYTHIHPFDGAYLHVCMHTCSYDVHSCPGKYVSACENDGALSSNVSICIRHKHVKPKVGRCGQSPMPNIGHAQICPIACCL